MMSKPPLDEKTLANVRETLGDDFIPELIDAYLEETPLLIKGLQEALADGDAQVFQRTAHSMKSSSSTLGAIDFAEKARELELIGKSGDLNSAAVKLAEFIGTYPELEQALRDLLSGLEAGFT